MAKPRCGKCGKMLSDYVSKLCKPCKGIEQRGDKNPNWKGGKFQRQDGYVMIYKPDHPNADNRGYVYEHTLVMSELINRALYPDEVVHHIDEVKCNNAPENLRLERKSTHMAFNHIDTKKKFSNEQMVMVVEMYMGGKSSIEIAKEFRCSVPTVLKWLRKNNIEIKNPGHYAKQRTGRSKLTDEQWETLAKEYHAKDRPAVADLAKKYNISKAMVSRGLKARGYEIRKNRWH